VGFLAGTEACPTEKSRQLVVQSLLCLTIPVVGIYNPCMETRTNDPLPTPNSDKGLRPKPEVIFNENHCKGCELCIAICPVKILKLDTSRVNIRGYYPAIIYNPDECTGCAGCAKICPDSVIMVRR